MVTFSLPGDAEAGAVTNGTPRARPPLPFAKRPYGASPFAPSSARRIGTPQATSARKILTTRDEVPSSSLSKNSIATARNIFRASSISDSPPITPFSPNLPQSTMKRVFAPGATPEPSRVYREKTAQATPRGMAAKTDDKNLFPMRIASPPRELSGEHLANQVPKEWNSKGSIYADQFLQHLAPPDLDEEQRRQFFCILDLRRLKYAADEIFANKAWKLNIMNFAKEYEKSRSIILLRYGLYEFQHVKPSKEVLKRWRREHGLPEPEEEEAPAVPTPSKSASKKRKADGDLTADTAKAEKQSSLGKRRATERAPEPEPIPDTSKVLGKTKRRASMDEEEDDQPSKRSTPSATKSLFEKIANNSSASPAPKVAEAAKKPSIFGASKPAAGGLARSVFENLKSGPGAAPAAAGGNIFGYLSDASSAKNSGVDADADSDTDSEADDSAEAGQSDEPSGNASATAETASQVGSTLFGNKPAAAAGVDAGGSSEPGTRESTPGRSLFDRVTKDDDGEPVRASVEPAEKPAADQTWNPSTTPLKFAPSASSTSSIFGKPAASSSASSIFAPKPTSSSSLFGAPKQDALAKDTPAASESEKEVGESDKENDSQPSKKPAFEPKTDAPAPSFGSLFQPKPATPASTENETPKPAASNLFGAAKPATSNLFGAASKPAESTPVMQSSTLFGAKPSESKPAEAEVTKPATTEATPATTESKPTPSLFGSQPAASGSASSLFGGASKPATSNLFGNSNASASSTAPKTDAAPAAAPAPTFTFGGSSATASKPLFGAPKSPPASTAPSNMFAGSPMKQDDQSPAKKMFTGGATNGASAPLFSFGGAGTTTPAPAPTFGGTVNTANTAAATNNAAISFGSDTSTATNGGSFGFNFGGGSTGTSFNNPFASGGASTNGASAAPAASSGGMFQFGGAAPAASSGSSFQFGGSSGSAPAPGGNIFGNQNAAAPAPVFGGASSNSGNTTGFNFTSAPAQGNGNLFGGNQPTPLAPSFGNSLQPPAGGSSTTGTSKSTFANRKIAPLKRRL